MRFTATCVKSARAPEGVVDLIDERYPGLVLRVTPAGTRTWRLLTTRADGSHTWTTVGYATKPARGKQGVPVVSLAEVLDVWAAARAGRRDKSPVSRLEAKMAALERELEAARLEAGYGLNFAELVKEFLERYSQKRHGPKYRADLRRMLARDPLPAWGEIPASALQRSEAAALLHRVAERGPIRANRLLAALRKMYRWGMAVGLVRSNPFADLAPLANENARELVLDDGELLAVWRVLESRSYPDPGRPGRACRLSPVMADALLLLMVTLQRREEVAALRWEALRERPWWQLSRTETKAGRAHRVFLSGLASAILERQTASRFQSAYVFPGRRGANHVHPDALSHAFARVREGLRAAGDVRRGYRVHDLRRTGRTGLSRLGVAPHVADRTLGHAVVGVRKHYDLHSWDAEVRDALERWSAHLSGLLDREAPSSAL